MESDDIRVAVDNKFLNSIIELIEDLDVDLDEEMENKIELYKNLVNK